LIGIDLGTSNTVAVLRDADGTARPLLIDGREVTASGAYYEGGGRFQVGAVAVNLAKTDPSRFEPNPKKHIGTDLQMGGETIRADRLVEAMLRTIAGNAAAEGDSLPRAAIAHPVAWSMDRRLMLRTAATRAGWSDVTMVEEPVAAANYLMRVMGHAVPAGRAVMVVDIGAGTTDIAVLRNEGNRLRVLGTGGVADLGGLGVDAALTARLGEQIARRWPERWEKLSDPKTTGEHNQRRMFLDEVRQAKEMLSSARAAVVSVPGTDEVLSLTRTELDEVARPLLVPAIEEIRRVLRECGFEPTDLAALMLVGGATRMPVIRETLRQALDVDPVQTPQPERPVAEGALSMLTVTAVAPAAIATPFGAVPMEPVTGFPGDPADVRYAASVAPITAPPALLEDTTSLRIVRPARRRRLAVVAGVVAVLLLATTGLAYAADVWPFAGPGRTAAQNHPSVRISLSPSPSTSLPSVPVPPSPPHPTPKPTPSKTPTGPNHPPVVIVTVPGRPTPTVPNPPVKPKPPACIVGSWSLVAMTADMSFTDTGNLHMTLEEGSETRKFNANGTTTVSGNFVLQAIQNGTIYGIREQGSGSFHYTASGGAVHFTNGSSVTGQQTFYINYNQVNQTYNPGYVNGTNNDSCSGNKLVLSENGFYAQYSRN
jgi:actin-like ATPase involved in cell morphogenesis